MPVRATPSSIRNERTWELNIVHLISEQQDTTQNINFAPTYPTTLIEQAGPDV